MAGSTLKTAFIRITSENVTKDGIVTYNKLDIENLLVEWSKSSDIEYWMIEHSADDEVSKTHFHIVLRFKQPMPFTNIKKKFPYGSIENARNIKNCVQYLIHQNDNSKVQYKWDDISHNCNDLWKYKVVSTQKNELDLQRCLEMIDSGEIREYNQCIKIPIELWSKYKSRIDNALTYYRKRIIMEKNRKIKIMFFTGSTGCGKTTFAKMWCEKQNKSYCISSSGNDSVQDYQGEDVLIFDDLRDTVFEFVDLLKILDNNTASSIKSRYYNKTFFGDTIIITSATPIQDWYFNLSADDKKQLYRRVSELYKLTKDDILCYKFDINLNRYELYGKAKNPVFEYFSKNDENINSLESIGIVVEKVESIKELSNEEWKQEVFKIVNGKKTD